MMSGKSRLFSIPNKELDATADYQKEALKRIDLVLSIVNKMVLENAYSGQVLTDFFYQLKPLGDSLLLVNVLALNPLLAKSMALIGELSSVSAADNFVKNITLLRSELLMLSQKLKETLNTRSAIMAAFLPTHSSLSSTPAAEEIQEPDSMLPTVPKVEEGCTDEYTMSMLL